MRAVVQRVRQASVTVDGEVVAAIGLGVVVLLGVASADTAADADVSRERSRGCGSSRTRTGRFDRSLLDVGGEALVVSQFTLIADSKRQKGTRPTSRMRRVPR